MNARSERTTTSASADRQLKGFIDKFEPRYRTLIRTARKAMRRRLPTALELAYDNQLLRVGVRPNRAPLGLHRFARRRRERSQPVLLQGARLADPKKVPLGAGNQTRFVRLPSADYLARPEIEAILSAAIAQARTPFFSRHAGGAYHSLRVGQATSPTPRRLTTFEPEGARRASHEGLR